MYLQIIQMCYYITSILFYIPQLIEGVFSRKQSKKNVLHSADETTIILNLEEKLSERDGVNVKCFSLMCSEIDDLIVR